MFWIRIIEHAPVIAALLVASGSQTGSVSAPANVDSEFVRMASAKALGELQLAQLADNQTENASVRKLADRVAADDAVSNEQLRVLASQNRMTVAGWATVEDGGVYDKFTGLSGTAFDQTYLDTVLSASRDQIAALQAEVDAGENQQLKSFAANQLPLLRERLRTAEKLAAELNVYPTTAALR